MFPEPKPNSVSEQLWSLLDDCAFLATRAGETFLFPKASGPGLLIPINHPSFRQFLCHHYSREFGDIPSPGALRSVIARAHDAARVATLPDFAAALRTTALPQPDSNAPPAIGIRHGNDTNPWYICADGAFADIDQEPCFYTGRTMKASHAGLGITEAEWNAAATHLVAALDKYHVRKPEKDEVIAFVITLKPDIVEKP